MSGDALIRQVLATARHHTRVPAALEAPGLAASA